MAGTIRYMLLGGAVAVAAVGYGDERQTPGSSADNYNAWATTGANLIATSQVLATESVAAASQVASEGLAGLQTNLAPLTAQPATSDTLPAGTAPEAQP